MSTVNSQIVVRIGSGPTDAVSGSAAISTGTPYVDWSLPAGLIQARSSILICNAEPGGTAYGQSGTNAGTDQSFYWPPGDPMGMGFAGLCYVEVAVSANTEGDFEYVSPPLYFVYDPHMAQVCRASEITLSWGAASDPDGLPRNSGRLFNLQVSGDPQFRTTLFDRSDICNMQDVTVSCTVPRFVPLLNQTYFYRVRQGDGLDWGDWSVVHAFRNNAMAAPTVQIVSMLPVNNAYGDMLITFDLADAADKRCAVSISYQGDGVNPDPLPISTIEAMVNFPPGRYTVTWRTVRQLSNQRYDQIYLFAGASNKGGPGPAEQSGPYIVDNSLIQRQATSGIGGDEWTWSVAGYLVPAPVSNAFTDTEPVTGGYLIPLIKRWWDDLPTYGGEFMWLEAYAICPLEMRTVNNSQMGWAHSSGYHLQWPAIIAHNTTPITFDKFVDAGRIAPTTNDSAFLFANPVAYGANGFPTSMSSRLLGKVPFLRGWLDANGVAQDYPDGYNFNQRPAWHRGREVWGSQDAWVQMVVVKTTHWSTCAICHGKHWIVSASAPYVRNPCTNPYCPDGFDHRYPMQASTGNPFCKAYLDVQWMRLSNWANGGVFADANSYGLCARQGPFATATQHVVGRGLSSQNAVYVFTTNYWGQQVKTLDHYVLPETNEWFPGTTGAPNTTKGVTLSGITRQLDDGARIGNYMMVIPKPQFWYHIVGRETPAPAYGYAGTTRQADDSPAAGGNLVLKQAWQDTEPVEGDLGATGQVFLMGMNPADHPGYASRPTPTQEGGLRASGNFGHGWTTSETAFRFQQTMWDAYNTLHWQFTGSDTTGIQVQYAAILSNGGHGEWSDVQGDGCGYNDAAKAWLANPLTFDMYWNTGDRSRLLNDQSYQLRLRQYDTTSRMFGDWAYSVPFEIAVGVTNPASILSSSYEPWSKIITVQFRLDDTEQRPYSVINLAWSNDDGVTWNPVGIGDVYGDTVSLSTTPGQNVHTLQWDTSASQLTSGDSYRLRLDVLPSSVNEDLMLPFFKWLTPVNPGVDAAETELVQILGTVNTNVTPPQAVGGTISNLESQLEAVRQRVTGDAAQGAYTFMTPDMSGGIVGKPWPADSTRNIWSITDTAGYDAWLQDQFSQTETNGQALARINQEIDYLNNTQVPALRQTLAAGEIAVRKRLMQEGFFAEQFFDTVNGQVVETITVPAKAQSTTVLNMVARWWRFHVTSIAEGPTGVYDQNGNYSPQDMTELETVSYRFQMDYSPTFDSQALQRPLRDEYNNYDGTPLAISQFSVPPQAGNATSPTNQPTNEGGTLTLTPSELPGKMTGDVMAAGQTTWNTNFGWRVAAYNAVVMPVTARPRPLITQVTMDATHGVAVVEYVAQAHDMMQSMSLHYSLGLWNMIFVDGYTVSLGFLPAPIWTMQPITWISDRRAALGTPSRQINSNNWVWPGTQRTRPTIIYDDQSQEYIGFVAKPDPNDFAGQRTRIMGFRAMETDALCEYDVYFQDQSPLKVQDPCLLKVNDTFMLYVTTQDTTGDAPSIALATSPDADQWSYLVTVMENASSPSVVYDAGQYTMFFTQPVAGVCQVFAAISIDGADWNTPIQITTEATDCSSPSAILLNGAWALYYAVGGQIVSVTGATLNAMGNRQIDVGAFQNSSRISQTPGMPYVFLDRYQGNMELFMLFVAADPSGNLSTWLGRLEDRVWQAGNSSGSGILGDAGNLTGVPCSRDGVPRQLNLSLAYNGIRSGTPLKVRLQFTSWSPTTTTYHRQSDWVVSPGNGGDSICDPPAFTYSIALDSYPYLAT